MTVTTWNLRYNDGNNWSSKYSIDNPTNDITVDINSTRRKHNLYDGSIGRTSPTTKYNYSNVDLDWAFISGGSTLIKTGAETSSVSLHQIMSGGYKVEFTTHTVVTIDSGAASKEQIWQGYLTSYPMIFKLGLYPATDGYETFYDLSVGLDITSAV